MVTFDEFVQINSEFPMILFEAFRLQDELQEKTLGTPTIRV